MAAAGGVLAAVGADDDLLGAAAGELDLGVDVGVGAEALDEQDLDGPGGLAVGDAQVLGAHAHDHAGASAFGQDLGGGFGDGDGLVARADVARRPTGASMMFMAGEPMKPATKTLLGVS